VNQAEYASATSGRGNPACDFQYFIPAYQVGQRYQMVMRAMCLPFESPSQIERASAPHRAALSKAKSGEDS
jgi:hypothetical protein